MLRLRQSCPHTMDSGPKRTLSSLSNISYSRPRRRSFTNGSRSVSPSLSVSVSLSLSLSPFRILLSCLGRVLSIYCYFLSLPLSPFVSLTCQQEGQNTMQFRAKLDAANSIDADRVFAVTFYLADDTVAVFEERQRNSGILGGMTPSFSFPFFLPSSFSLVCFSTYFCILTSHLSSRQVSRAAACQDAGRLPLRTPL